MKCFWLLLFAATAAILTESCGDGSGIQEYPYPTHHGQITYFQEKDGLYSTFKISKNDIVLVGDDLFDRGVWDAFYGSDRVKNRGIALEGTECTRYRIGKIAAFKPAKIFISTGLYDIKQRERVSLIRSRILEIYTIAQMVSPASEIYVLGLAPDGACRKAALRDSVEAVNDYLSSELGKSFLDLAGEICDSTGYISQYFLIGDNRINGAGYEVISRFLSPYIGLMPYNTVFNDSVMNNYIVNPQSTSAYPRIEYYSNFYNTQYKGMSDHYKARLSIFNSIPNSLRKNVIIGNSISNNCWWNELFEWSYADVVNKGISGDVTSDIIARLDDINDENPARVFIMAGVNDFIANPSVSVKKVWENYKVILGSLRESHPNMEIYVLSTLPLSPKSRYYSGRNAKIRELDALLSASESLFGYHYIDLVPAFSDADGNLKESLTADGIHLLPEGYGIWKELIEKSLN